MKKLSLIVCLLTISVSTLLATTYTWKPTSGTNANNLANWKIGNCNGGSVPTSLPSSSDTIVFSNCSVSSCTLDVNLSASLINVKSTYTGAIIANSGITLTFTSGLFTGGAFDGGSATITFNESFRINGCSYTSTSGVMTCLVM